jgi:hypothetical protein
MAVRVLHVWNTAGVGSVIAKFTDREFGTASSVITRLQADRVGLTTYGKAYDEGAAVFFARGLLAARRADVVHVHSLDRIVPWLRRLYPHKPVVMHYHGTDIQGRWAEKSARWRRADFVAYSTPNLGEGAPPSARWMANPVDTDIFYPRGVRRQPSSALSFHYGMDEEGERVARERSLALTWVDRWTVKHDEMPQLLSGFEYYVDLRRPPGRSVAGSVGKAALESLACGCKVIDWSGGTVERLPEEHLPARVARAWYEVYRRLLEERPRAASGAA